MHQLVTDWQLVEAEERAARFYEKYPDNVEAAKIYGDILIARGEVHNAREIFRKLTSIDDIHLLTLYDRAPKEFDSIQPLLVTIGEMHQAIASQRIQLSHSFSKNSTGEIHGLPELKSVLSPGEVFISYFVSNEKVYAYAVREDDGFMLEISITEEELRSLTDVYMHSILRGYKDPAGDLWRSSSHKLYTLFIEPLTQDSLIRENESIIISPHKSLHVIPFHALSITDKHRRPEFLLERYYVSYVPSASIFVESRNRKKQPIRRCLTVAPDVDTLPFSYREISAVPRALFPTIDYLTGAHARGDVILGSFNNYDVVHISSHTKMNYMFPNASYIKLADRKLRLHELFQRNIITRLVVLSSCGSGLGIGTTGRIPSGYDLVSFPRAFLTAGASTVIASLWIVEDETTMMVMKNFYDNLHYLSRYEEFLPLSTALINAQRQHLEKSRRTGKKMHPFFWAPFVLVGDTK